ncbi:hypothetical protein [Ciceribacter sp. RN22]|uniref:hypothetical protein n=1 Tax=Ciceribacter sp. RN22 TaxID=2954932 RepID=UPI002093BACE|nr:hypothetical protein [Ciceribacter sp. RN22]MCO6177492.1 hypothetical protein [Ciceribacter sp. RN22]
MLPQIHAIWIGRRLGPVHAACLESFQRVGHQVFLHCYQPPDDVPAAIGIFDARRIMRPEEMIRFRTTGSPSLGTNTYRYRLLQKELGIYVDTDVFCLSPLADEAYILGFEETSRLNGAILKLPPDCPMLADLLKATRDPYFIPPWQRKGRRARDHVRKLLRVPRHVSSRPWGIYGPDLITYFARKHKLTAHAKPIDVFYPVHYAQTSLLFEKGLSLRDLITPRTKAIHLYNNSFSGPVVFEEGTPMHDIVMGKV